MVTSKLEHYHDIKKEKLHCQVIHQDDLASQGMFQGPVIIFPGATDHASLSSCVVGSSFQGGES